MAPRVPRQNESGKPPSLDDFPGKDSEGTTFNGTSGFSKPKPIPAQSDARRVVIGYQQVDEPGRPPRPIGSTVYEEMRQFGTLRVTDPQGYQATVNMLRATGLLGAEANSWSSIEGAYKDLLEIAAGSFSSGKPITVDAAAQMLINQRGGVDAGAGGGGGRGGAYTGPFRSVTVAAESDIRATADAIGMEMLGRGVSDEEFQRILKRTRAAEQAQPDVTTSGVASRETRQGLSAEGRQDIIQNILAKKPEYEEFQKATTLMSWFDRALQERMQQ